MASVLRALGLNWKLKLLAFTLAILLWIVVSAEEVTSRWIDVPLQVRVTDPEYMLVQEMVPREVSVRFSGPRRELIDLRFRRPPLVLNILDVADVRESFPLQTRMVQIPAQLSVNVVDMQPSTLDLRFTRVETRSYPVRLRLAGPLPAGWIMADSIVAEPARIRVSGTEARLANVDSIMTRPVSLPLTDTAFSLSVPIDTTQIAGLRVSARRVQISGRLDREVERVYSGIPVSVGAGIIIQPATVDVRISGPSSVVRTLAPSALRVVIAIDSVPDRIREDGVRVPLRVERLPPGLEAVVSPSTVVMLPRRPVPDTVVRRQETEPADTLDLLD